MGITKRRAMGWIAALVLGGGPFGDLAAVAPPAAERREPAQPEGRAARRRWALARMDEMDNERMRCRERFARKREIEICEADYTRRFRHYNELYLELSRDAESGRYD